MLLVESNNKKVLEKKQRSEQRTIISSQQRRSQRQQRRSTGGSSTTLLLYYNSMTTFVLLFLVVALVSLQVSAAFHQSTTTQQAPLLHSSVRRKSSIIMRPASSSRTLLQRFDRVRNHPVLSNHHHPYSPPRILSSFGLSSTLASRAETTSAASAAASSGSTTVELQYTDFLSHDDDSRHAPVVFLHGLLGNKKNFATIATSLGNQLQKKRRIIGLDLRNHGDNHHDWRDSMNYSEMAQDLLAFLDAQGISKAVLVGHSMGGKVAQAVALQEPSRVDGLVVLDIAPVGYSNDEPHWKAVQDIVTVLAEIPVGPGVTRRDVDVALRSAIPDPALRAFCLTNFDAASGKWKVHIDAICAQLDEIASFNLDNGNDSSEQQQQQYPGDAFFIHGGQSRFVRHAYIPAIQEYFPNHMLTTVRGAGHWIHAEKPEDTIALIKRFLER